MKKIIFLSVLMLMLAIGAMAQTVVSTTIQFSNCPQTSEEHKAKATTDQLKDGFQFGGFTFYKAETKWKISIIEGTGCEKVDYYIVEENKVPQGAIDALFSISNNGTDTSKVYFSSGNLQYQASTGTWRFAAQQYTIIGNAAGNTTTNSHPNYNQRATQSDWIDLFAYGTSGYNAKYPYLISSNYEDYPKLDLVGDENSKYDWGVYNAIYDAGGKAGMWRVLTSQEWNYLFNTRKNASNKWAYCRIMFQPSGFRDGLIVLPDNFVYPTSQGFPAWVAGKSAYTSYTEAQWEELEANGAIFLPGAGYQTGYNTSVESTNTGYYWSSTNGGDNSMSKGIYFKYDGFNATNSQYRNYHTAVRLVADQQK